MVTACHAIVFPWIFTGVVSPETYRRKRSGIQKFTEVHATCVVYQLNASQLDLCHLNRHAYVVRVHPEMERSERGSELDSLSVFSSILPSSHAIACYAMPWCIVQHVTRFTLMCVLCYAVLRCATLFHAVPRCAMLCHAVPRCATLCHAVPRCATLCHAVPRRAMLCCAVLCYAVLCCPVLCYAMP